MTKWRKKRIQDEDPLEEELGFQEQQLFSPNLKKSRRSQAPEVPGKRTVPVRKSKLAGKLLI